MSPFAISLISFGCIFGGTLLGFYLGHRLPADHIGADSKDTVKTAWGMIATMSALVLSLLVASAKGSFDNVSAQNTQAAAKIIMLDRLLVRYGPQADAVRVELRRVVSSEIDSDWKNQGASLVSPADMEKANGMEEIEDELNALSPASDAQRGILSQARQISDDLFQGRVLVVEQAHIVLPPVLQVALVTWLTVLFVGISLFAPRNKTVVVTLLLCCGSLSFAIFLINDLSHPLHGIITISSAPLREALHYLARP